MTTPISTASAAGAASTAATQQHAQLTHAAQQFEAIFLRQLLSSARSAKLADDDEFGSDATDQFREMSDAQTADSLSKKGVFGIADMLISHLGAVAPGAAAAASVAGRAAHVLTGMVNHGSGQ